MLPRPTGPCSAGSLWKIGPDRQHRVIAAGLHDLDGSQVIAFSIDPDPLHCPAQLCVARHQSELPVLELTRKADFVEALERCFVACEGRAHALDERRDLRILLQLEYVVTFASLRREHP